MYKDRPNTLSRRELLKLSGYSAAGLALLGFGTSCQQLSPGSMQEGRVEMARIAEEIYQRQGVNLRFFGPNNDEIQRQLLGKELSFDEQWYMSRVVRELVGIYPPGLMKGIGLERVVLWKDISTEKGDSACGFYHNNGIYTEVLSPVISNTSRSSTYSFTFHHETAHHLHARIEEKQVKSLEDVFSTLNSPCQYLGFEVTDGELRSVRKKCPDSVLRPYSLRTVGEDIADIYALIFGVVMGEDITTTKNEALVMKANNLIVSLYPLYVSVYPVFKDPNVYRQYWVDVLQGNVNWDYWKKLSY